MASCLESVYRYEAGALPAADPTDRWYALQIRGRHEKMVEHRLMERGVPTFLPLITEIHHWSDRRKKIQFPLFSGYLFVRVPSSKVNYLRVMSVEGVFNFVGNRGEGTPIPDAQIEAVRSVVEKQLAWSSHPFLKIGQRVRIKSGALDGVEGILTSRSGDATLIISVDAIQRSLAVRVEGYDVEPI
jgi:transcription antitermination factor NusG